MAERTNNEWLDDLKASGPRQDSALADLRAIITKGLPFGLSRWLSPIDPHFNALIDEVAQDTLLRVLDQLHTFEGRSRFTTWVHKIAIRIALSELRRKRWKDKSLDEMMDHEEVPIPKRLLGDNRASPEERREQSETMDRIMRIITDELTDKQRTALVALTIHGMPLDEVARQMDTNRNALYKLLHDARVRLKHRMAAEGLSPQEVLSLFENE